MRLCSLSVWLVAAVAANISSAEPIADSVDAATDRRANLLRLAVFLDRVHDQTTGETRDVITDLQAATRAQVRAALQSLIPELAAHHILRRAYASARRRIDRPDQPTQQVHYFSLNAVEPDSTSSTGMSTGIWMQAFADSIEQDDRDGIQGFDSDGRGFTIGLDRSISERARAGVSYSRIDSDLTSNRFGADEVTRDDYSVYSSYFFGRHAVSMNLAYSRNETDRLRPIVVPTSDGLRAIGLFSRIDSTQWTTTAAYDLTFTSGSARIGPFAMLSYSNLETDDFVEQSAGEFALIVATEDEKQLLASVGLRYSYDFFTDNWIISPGFVAAYHRDLLNDETNTVSRLRGSDLGFASTGFGVQEGRVNGGVNVGVMHIDGFSAFLSFDLELQDDYQYQGVILGAQYNF